MKRLLSVIAVAIFTLGFNTTAAAVVLHVDSAPNVYGSSDWAPWWDATKADVVAATFTNMRTGAYPGTTKMDPYDEIVYSTGDLGKRLHWIYWLDGQSVSALSGLFEVKWVIDWDGSDWTYEAGAWAADAPTVGWSEPNSWEDYAGGVIGSLGFAWWATDNDAPPLNSGGNAYDETDQADIDALRQDVLANQTYATGMVRYRQDTSSNWQYTTLSVQVVPEPAPLALLGIGLAGLWWARRQRRA